jgi:pimeloyl-ACP methyl ester carboxylesterase
MKNLIKYGSAPFNIALIHGGPGAPGEMASLARELSFDRGVLEPLQTAMTIDGQLIELKSVLKKNGDFPVILIGWSWGAWLSFIFSAQYPSIIKKLILIGSGPYEENYAKNIMKTRLNRISKRERAEVLSLIKILNDPSVQGKNTPFASFGKLISKIDSYDPITYDSEIIEYRYDIYQSIWTEATKLRNSGKLLELGKKIQCSVVAIHGDYDPHPAEGIKYPLSRTLVDFRFILLEKCGHYPWIERNVRDEFNKILKNEIR